MCSWCWGFAPTLDVLLAELPADVQVCRLLGGLAPDCDQPMPEETRRYVQRQWHRIQERIPGTIFNFDFWTECAPRRSTYPACRAVIAARQQGVDLDARMTTAIQRAYYLQARNPSDLDTLMSLAGELGLDTADFSQALRSDAIQRQLLDEIDQSRSLGAEGFPSLVLEEGGRRRSLRIEYVNHRAMLQQLDHG
ncbi:MAG: DsbA family protein [Gammaproteobacteria bacterium]|nr:MAG: DsbA family protein [Gammaproteobacteria bacterium]